MTDIDNAYSGRFAEDGKTHILPVRIYYKDTDMSGIVYHGNYVTYFERGRTDHMREIGITHTDIGKREKPLAFAVIAMDLRFKKAARIDDNLLVHTKYMALNGAKIHIKQWITRKNDKGGEDMICTNDITAVTIDMNGMPQRPQADIVEAFQPYLADKE